MKLRISRATQGAGGIAPLADAQKCSVLLLFAPMGVAHRSNLRGMVTANITPRPGFAKGYQNLGYQASYHPSVHAWPAMREGFQTKVSSKVSTESAV